ncbi:MAG: protein kinase [Kofleriaceae bacterium]|nr:protein kinase [Kofleriaceae bacterium]
MARAGSSSLDREVAIKVLADRYAPGEPQERLLDEARAMARLTHPNVIAVHDAGVRHSRIFLAMELVRGVPLSTWLATPRPWLGGRGPVPPARRRPRRRSRRRSGPPRHQARQHHGRR